jgi:hypothetical protein
MMKNKLKKIGVKLGHDITKEDFLLNCDSIFPDSNSKTRELMNKTLSQMLKQRNNEIDSLVARFIVEKKVNPSDVTIVFNKTEYGEEVYVKHKYANYRKKELEN